MGTKLYLNCFVIIFTILCQGIRISSEEDVDKSSDLHFRRKRLINLGGHEPVAISNVIPYIVHIKIGNKSNFCGGSILGSQVILTAAHCVANNSTKYTVLSASSNKNNGIYHRVLRKIVYPEFRNTLENDLAMLIIYPPINFASSHNRVIHLYSGLTTPINSLATLSGWGCTELVGDRRVFQPELKSLNVHTISQEECQHIYGPKERITNKEICTFDHMKQKGSCHGDSGGPLVINGQLVGLLSWAKTFSKPIFPDVYTNLAYGPFRQWIYLNLNRYEHYQPGCFGFPKFCSRRGGK